MDIKKELKFIFANVNELLRFAEAKHGGIMVLNAGIVVGIISNLDSLNPYLFRPSMIFGLTCMGISVLLSIVSQFPVTQNEIFYKRREIHEPNMYFFGHLCHFDTQFFIDELIKIEPGYVADRLDRNLINQIITNARIVKTKFFLFKIACYLTGFGALLIGASTFIKVIWQS